MKKILFLFVALLGCYFLEAQQLKTPAQSPTMTVKQDFALSSIELNFSRPSVKGRKIFGDLVPYGKVWRTGANSATTVTFGDEVVINNVKVPAGKYGLLTIPDAETWTIIISKQTTVSSPADYKQEMDLVRVQVTPIKLPFSIETFNITIDDISNNSCIIGILWDNIYAPLVVTTDVDTKIMAQIKSLMEGDSRPYYNAGIYYLDNGKDLNKALEWITKATDLNPKAFWMMHQKANCLAKLGRKEDAITAATKSMELAKDAKNMDYVALNEKLIASLK